MNFTSSEINHILGDIQNLETRQIESLNFKNVSINSRTILKNDLFIAIKGINFDGHNFLLDVVNKGVKAVVIKEGMQKLLPSDYPHWTVKDTLEAFQKLTLFKRQKLNIPVVGITGSVGKTTTKEMIGEILKGLGQIKISAANFNNEIGVGLTILDADIKDKVLILEMGMRGFGQIENLSKFSEPDIAVITNIGSAHIGLLGSKENITYAKCEITKYLNPEGVVIIPANDKYLEATLKKNWKGRLIKVELLDFENLLNGNNDTSKKELVVDLDKVTQTEKGIEVNLIDLHNKFQFYFL